MPIIYHEVVPENNKSSFVAYDVVDYILSFPNEKINLGSIRIEGELTVYSTGTTNLNAESIQMDKMVGAHSLFSHVQTFVSGQSIDNIIEYPRMVKSMISASSSANDMNNGSNACELKACSDVLARKILRREIPVNQYSVAPNDQGLFKVPDFSIKPMISLNRSIGDSSQASYNQTGDIMISVQMAEDAAVFYGIENTANANYKIENMRVVFSTYPDDGQENPIVLRKTVSVQQSFIGQIAQLNMNAPIIADRCYGTFIKQSNMNVVNKNNLALEKPIEPKSVKFLWNNSSNEFISYELLSEPEIIDNYLTAMGFSGTNNLSLMNNAANNGYGIGIRMGDFIDMMASKLTVVLQSNVVENTNYVLTMFFEGTLKL